MCGVKLNNSSYESSISKRLIKDQFDSDSPAHFEEALTETFIHLGFEAEHIGGPNEPDILVTLDKYRCIIEAKTSKGGIINESFINFDAIDRYASDKEVEYKAVVAPKFRTGNVIETAKKHRVMLIETEALCEILEHHLISPLSANELISLLFEMDVPVLTSDTVLGYISPESDLISGSIWILNYMMKLSETSEQSISLSKLKTLHEFHGGTFNWQVITDSLEFLASPPIAVISETNSNYSLNGDPEEIIEKVDIMQKAFKELRIGRKMEKEFFTPVRYSKMKTAPSDSRSEGRRVTTGQFKHIGDGNFQWNHDPNVILDLKVSIGKLQQQMREYGIWTQNPNGFQWYLRNQVGLIRRND